MHLVHVKLVLQTNHHTMHGTYNIKIDCIQSHSHRLHKHA